jgi:hypothetical protein
MTCWAEKTATLLMLRLRIRIKKMNEVENT